jgi:hypothetical protein
MQPVCCQYQQVCSSGWLHPVVGLLHPSSPGRRGCTTGGKGGRGGVQLNPNIMGRCLLLHSEALQRAAYDGSPPAMWGGLMAAALCGHPCRCGDRLRPPCNVRGCGDPPRVVPAPRGCALKYTCTGVGVCRLLASTLTHPLVACSARRQPLCLVLCTPTAQGRACLAAAGRAVFVVVCVLLTALSSLA